MRRASAILSLVSVLLTFVAQAAEPGPVCESVELGLADKDVARFFADRTDDGAKQLGQKVLAELKAYALDARASFHFRYTDKALELFYPKESRGLVTVLAVRLVFLVDAEGECYGYASGVAALTLSRKALEAAFSPDASRTEPIVAELRGKLGAYSVRKASEVETRVKKDGEVVVVFTNALGSNYPSVEASLRPVRDGRKLQSFSFAVYAYPQGAESTGKVGFRIRPVEPLSSGAE